MKQFAYTGSYTTENKQMNRSAAGVGIHCFSIDSHSGLWEEIQTIEEPNPSFIHWGKKQNVLYAANSSSGFPVPGIVSYRADKETGFLSRMDTQLDLEKPICCLCIHPEGRYLVTADFKGMLQTIELNEDGSLSRVVFSLNLEGPLSPLRSIKTSRPHHCLFDKNGRHLIVADKGLDLIFVFAFDSSTGALTETCRTPVRPASCARHIAFHPDERFVYIIAEYSCKIYVFDYDKQSGTLSPKQILSAERDSCTGICKSAEIQVHPNGRFLYVSNRYDNSIGIFKISEPDGRLTPIGWEDTRGEKPRFFCLDKEGKHLYVGNQGSGTISVFEIDSETGALAPKPELIPVECPTWILFSQSCD